MKGRESGMPEKELWEQFFNPEEVLKVMGLSEHVRDVAEFGCGYGTFTIPAARIVKGAVFAFDIESEIVAATQRVAEKNNLHNVKPLLRDFIKDDTGLEKESVDYVMLFNILHIEHPEILLEESHRILRRGGKLGIIHWNYDLATPRGPSMAIRPKPEQCIAWAETAGFSNPKQHDLPPYHYGIVLTREEI